MRQHFIIGTSETSQREIAENRRDATILKIEESTSRPWHSSTGLRHLYDDFVFGVKIGHPFTSRALL